MTQYPPLDANFRRPTMCQDESKRTCVEVAVHDGVVLVRDSKAPGEGLLRFTPAEWNAFVEGVKLGQFELS